MLSACKKENEMKNKFEPVLLKAYGTQTNTPPPQDTLLFYYYLAATNVMIDSVLCDKYVSSEVPSSIIYIPKTDTKALFRRYKWDAWVNSSTYQIECSGSALKECYNRADGSVAVSRNAHIQFN